MAKKKIASDESDAAADNYDMVTSEPADLAEPEVPNDPSTFNEEEGKYKIGELVVATGTTEDDDYADDSNEPVDINEYEEIDPSKEARASKLLTPTADEETAAGFVDEDPWLEKMDYDPDNAGLEDS